MSNQICQYIRNNKNQRVGLLVATPIPHAQEVGVGWSLAHRSAGDAFDTERGYEIAFGRAVKVSQAKVPTSITDQYNHFVSRATKYFKDKKVVSKAIDTTPVAPVQIGMARIFIDVPTINI